MKQDNIRDVAIVDGNDNHMGKVCKVLMSHFNMRPYSNTKTALSALTKNAPKVILVNSVTGPQAPQDFVASIRATRELNGVKVICIVDSETDPLRATVMEAGADTCMTKPYPPSVLINTITQQLTSSVEKGWEKLPEVQKQALTKSADVFSQIADVLFTGESIPFRSVQDNCQPLVTAIESNDFTGILDGVRGHDDYTYAHSMRVATMLTLLGHAAGFNNDEQLLLASGGLLHDVGKMKIPHNILNKPGRLDEQEFSVMKSHVPETIEYLKKCENIPKAVFIIAEQHHEKIDGTGYPYGLKGKELNELARMAAIVDVFSALTDKRVYKEPMEAGKAMTIMTDEMSGHLDPHYIKLFRSVLIDTGVLK